MYRYYSSLICACLLTVVVAKVRYDGYAVLEVTPTTESHVYMLHDLQSSTQLDFWLEPSVVNAPVHVLVGPHESSSVRSVFQQAGMDVTIHIDDVQRELDIEERRLEGKTYNDYDWTDYNPVETIYDELDNMARDCPESFTCTVKTIGFSVEGMDMKVLQVDTGLSTGRSIWFDSLIHAREWIAGATSMMIVDKLIRGYGVDDDATAIMDRYERLYFLPVMNPDGYNHTWTENRVWRKNRRVGETCYGVDLNRNHNSNWGVGLGSAPFECMESYRGPSNASEPETAAVERFVMATNDNIEVLISFHAYGRYWLIPYGNCTKPLNWEDTSRVGDATARAIESVYNSTWVDGNSCEKLYMTTGTTVDWAQDIGVPYSYTPELRGPAFFPQPAAIPKSFAEIWAGLNAMFDAIDE